MGFEPTLNQHNCLIFRMQVIPTLLLEVHTLKAANRPDQLDSLEYLKTGGRSKTRTCDILRVRQAL